MKRLTKAQVKKMHRLLIQETGGSAGMHSQRVFFYIQKVVR
jgi:hypothetical protein